MVGTVVVVLVDVFQSDGNISLSWTDVAPYPIYTRRGSIEQHLPPPTQSPAIGQSFGCQFLYIVSLLFTYCCLFFYILIVVADVSATNNFTTISPCFPMFEKIEAYVWVMIAYIASFFRFGLLIHLNREVFKFDHDYSILVRSFFVIIMMIWGKWEDWFKESWN